MGNWGSGHMLATVWESWLTPGVTLLLDPGVESELACLKMRSGEQCVSIIINFWSNNHWYSLGWHSHCGCRLHQQLWEPCCKSSLQEPPPKHKVIEGLLVAPHFAVHWHFYWEFISNQTTYQLIFKKKKQKIPVLVYRSSIAWRENLFYPGFWAIFEPLKTVEKVPRATSACHRLVAASINYMNDWGEVTRAVHATF